MKQRERARTQGRQHPRARQRESWHFFLMEELVSTLPASQDGDNNPNEVLYKLEDQLRRGPQPSKCLVFSCCREFTSPVFRRHFQKIRSLRPKATFTLKHHVLPDAPYHPTGHASPSQPTRGHPMIPDDPGPTDRCPGGSPPSPEHGDQGELPLAHGCVPLLLLICFGTVPANLVLGWARHRHHLVKCSRQTVR